MTTSRREELETVIKASDELCIQLQYSLFLVLKIEFIVTIKCFDLLWKNFVAQNQILLL